MDYLVFKRFIARGLVMVAWWLGIIGITVFSVTLTKRPFYMPTALVILAWPIMQIVWRLICEVMIVQFSISEHLSKIGKHLQSIQGDDKSSAA
jgi:hypothetical protein